MNNKIIIISTCAFLLISFMFLSWTENKQADINTKKIWMVYFENPKDESLNFKIENHSKNTVFGWQINENGNVLKEGAVTIENGETKKIPVLISPADTANKKITISVTSKEEKKEIYKIL